MSRQGLDCPRADKEYLVYNPYVTKFRQGFLRVFEVPCEGS